MGTDNARAKIRNRQDRPKETSPVRYGDIRLDITRESNPAHWTHGAPRSNVAVMARLTIRIDFEGKDGFGPGKARLLEAVAQTGSIRRAAATMEMSYRQAWLLIASIEKTFGAPAVATATGGTRGGGARLTELGETILARYRAIEKKAQDAAAAEIAAFAKAGGRENLRKTSRKRARLSRAEGT
jgi:molybdate transport system regulatory protein